MGCFWGAITDSSQRFNSVADLLKVVPSPNPISGPIAVKGAGGGDIVAELGPDTKVCQIRGDVIGFPLQHRTVHLLVRPMIGTIRNRATLLPGPARRLILNRVQPMRYTLAYKTSLASAYVVVAILKG